MSLNYLLVIFAAFGGALGFRSHRDGTSSTSRSSTMSASLDLIFQYFDNEKKNSFALDLSKNLKRIENLSTLADIIHLININDELFNNIKEFALHSISTSTFSSNLITLIEKIPKLYEFIINSTINSIKLHLSTPGNNLILPVDDLIISSESSFFFNYLTLLSELFKTICLPNNDLDTYLLKCYCINDDEVLTVFSLIFRWRIDLITNHALLLKVIYQIHDFNSKSHISFAQILWIRYLSTNPDVDFLQSHLSLEPYWKLIQSGLTSDSHEHRKFCLTILQLSIKLIKNDVDNDYMKWEMSKSNVHLKEWARYITLFEILGIDTSLHQAEAGMNDMIALLSPKSMISSSWGFSLLATGFKATMDSVRKFALQLFLNINPSYLFQLKYCLNFLQDIYIPNIMIASRFSIRLVDGVQTCPFGNQIIDFITNLFENLNDEDASLIIESFLHVLARQHDCFDPMKIYIGIGLLQGLKTRQILKFGVHDHYLIRLFESASEGDLFETICQTIYLRLLLNFKYDQEKFFAVLNKFEKIRGFKIIANIKSQLKDYLDGESVSEDHTNALLSAITGKYELANEKVAGDLLKTNILESLSSESTQIFKNIISRLISGKLDDPLIFQSLVEVDFSIYPEIIPNDLSSLWSIILSEVESKDPHTLRLLVNKFKLFNNLYEHGNCKFDNLESLMNRDILKHGQELSKSFNKFYKISDDIYGEYYRSLEITFKRNPIDSTKLVNLLNPNKDHLKSNVAMINLIKHKIESGDDLMPLVSFTSELWNNLVESRLQLNQNGLQVAVIETMLNANVLRKSVESKEVGEMLTKYCLSVISQSSGRRSLLPALATMLCDFYTNSSDVFAQMKWVPEILIRLFLVFQVRNHGFKLEAVLGDVYDTLLMGSGNLYNEVYGPEEISAKVKLLTIFNSIKSKEFANSIFDYILDNATEFKFLVVERLSDGLEEWTRLQLMSIIVSIMDIADIPLDLFEDLIETDPSPLVRAYIEWFIAYKLKNNEEDLTRVLQWFIKAAPKLKMTTLIAYQRLLFLTIRQLPKGIEVDYLSKLIPVITLSSTTNKATTRHFSVSLIVSIHDEIEKKQLTIDQNLNSLVDTIYSSAVSAESFSDFRRGDALLWDIAEDYNLVTIAGGLLLRLSDRNDFDFITYQTFEKYITSEERQLLNHSIGDDSQILWVKEIKKDSKAKSKVNLQSPLQTKSGAFSSIIDVDESSRGSEIIRSDLIVVSSLVDKAPNLGGICRLCDVLGAGLMTLDDISIQNNKEFKNVAVTADQWMPMIEVKIENIKNYLKEKKQEGYTLIGLEQTDKSVELNYNVKFPKKSLILIGKEKEGVPGDLLAELDFCVEIKQVGVIRSMNIQTATAVLVHAYSVQHC